MRAVVVIVGAALATAIAFGRALGGVLGANTAWYGLGLAIPYFLLSVLLCYRLTITRRNNRPTTRAVWVLTALSWASAAAFALTVPDVQSDGRLASLVAPLGADQLALEMSIALCNPFAILSFLFLGLACGTAWFNSRPPYIEH